MKIPAQLRQERGTVSGKGGPSAAPYMVLGGPYFLPWLVRGTKFSAVDEVFCRGRSGGTDFGGDQLSYDSAAAILEATEQTSDDALQQQTSIEGTVPA